MLIIIAIISTVFALLLNLMRRSKFELPPGPKGLPLIGNLFALRSKPFVVLSSWAEKYGTYYTIRFGHKNVLVVNELGTMKKLFGTMASTGRFLPEVIQVMTYKGHGVAAADGSAWIEQRQFYHEAMKQLGLDNGVQLERSILESISELFDWIDEEQTMHGQVKVDHVLKLATSGRMWKNVTSEENGNNQLKMADLFQNWIKSFVQTKAFVLIFPWIKYIALDLSGYNGVMAATKKMHVYIENIFEEHLKSRPHPFQIRDVIDAYISKVENCTDPNSSFYGDKGWKHSYASVLSIMLAMGEGMGAVVHWIIFFLIAYPEIQEKLHTEIDEQLGKSRNPQLQQKASFPYMDSIIHETARYINLIPLGIVHQLLEDVTFDNYCLPKGLLLLPNIRYIHFDKNIWGDPENFRPERFMENAGGSPSLKSFVVPFQPGRRSCPGESTAKSVIFLVATKFFQKYKFSSAPSVSCPKEYAKHPPGLDMLIQDLHVVATPRF